LGGFDALLSTAQMPGGIPVATVAVGKTGARNAGYLAAQMLSLGDESILERLETDRAENRDRILSQNQRLQTELDG
jgi:5-(carboxyamino)imidazole ribonucleotide mutase